MLLGIWLSFTIKTKTARGLSIRLAVSFLI